MSTKQALLPLHASHVRQPGAGRDQRILFCLPRYPWGVRQRTRLVALVLLALLIYIGLPDVIRTIYPASPNEIDIMDMNLKAAENDTAQSLQDLEEDPNEPWTTDIAEQENAPPTPPLAPPPQPSSVPTTEPEHQTAGGSKNDPATPSHPDVISSPEAGDSMEDLESGITWEQQNESRRKAIKEAFVHAWTGYKEHAWGHDELRPNTGTYRDPFHGWSATLVDSLDTMYIMNLTKEFEEARDFVGTIDWYLTKDKNILFFETVIRYLGGLLSAYELSTDAVFLQKARELGDMLLSAFSTVTGLPAHRVNIKSGKLSNPPWGMSASLLAEVGSCQLEFTKLSQHTGDRKYSDAVQKVIDVLDAMKIEYPGLWPNWVDHETGLGKGSEYGFGAGSDSFYEYLLKRYLLNGKTEEQYFRMYSASADALQSKLLSQSADDPNLYFLGDLRNGQLVPSMSHLACFSGGLLALGAITLDGRRADDLDLAIKLGESCYRTYERSPNGITSEGWKWREYKGPDTKPDPSNQIGFKADSRGYALRPETVETLFILHRATGNPKYQDWGWKIFKSIVKHCKTKYGFSALSDNGSQNNSMESFFLAETLKYLYLLFSPRTVLPLDQWTFNTEAHPLRIYKNSPIGR